MLREAVMKTFYEFQSEADPDLHGFTGEQVTFRERTVDFHPSTSLGGRVALRD